MKLIRFKRDNFIYPEYGIVEGQRILPLKNLFSISELFLSLHDNRFSTEGTIPLKSVRPLPPTDDTANVYCAGLNYRDHAEEIRMPIPAQPIFFCKGGGALCGASDDIHYPDSVTILDYEIELAVIIGKKVGKDDRITAKNLGDYLLGISIFNDISARDIQLSAGQWFLGKSFRTFAPLGPVIQIFDGTAAARVRNLRLDLQVYAKNGQPHENKKQIGSTENMIFPIEELILTLSSRFDLRPGDVIATGTPCGVALSRPSRLLERLAEIAGIPQGKRIEMFIRMEKNKNRKYLERGDTIVARIYSDDGKVNLGEQRNRIIPD